ncbi:MAG TPA: hypothetical protein VGD74_02245 [Vulgatibacter sp.]
MNHSHVYPYAVFVHVVGAMALVAFDGLEWASLLRLRRISDPAQVPDALASFGAGRILIALSGPVLFLSGLYMTWAAWSWSSSWIVTGVAAMVLLAILGGSVTGKHVQALMASGGADLPARLPPMWASFVTQVAVLVGVIFLMCAKPGLVGSIVAMVVSLAVGKLLARRSAQPATAPTA